MSSVATWLRTHGDSGPIVYTLAFALLSGLALLPTYAQSALGGLAFGLWIGCGAALVGFALGAIIGFEIAKCASGERVMRVIQDYPKLAIIRDALVGKDTSDPTQQAQAQHKSQPNATINTRPGFWKTTGLVALVRMPPNSPFALTNLVLASVQVPRASFVLGTLVGMLPRTAAAVYIGHTAGLAADGSFPYPKWMIVAGIVGAVIVVLVISRIADRAIKSMALPAHTPATTRASGPTHSADTSNR